MDLNLFATQIVQSGQKSSGGNALAGSGFFGGAGIGGTGIDFWNAILGNIAQEVTEAKPGNENEQSHIKREEIKKETVDLALLQLALLGQDPDVNIDEKLAELRIERISQNPENRVEQLTKLIKHLTSGLPAVTDENTSVEELVTRLTKRLEKLESSLDSFRSGDFGDEGAPFKLLIATGLNPAQLTKITTRIEEVETKLGRELTVEDLIAGVGNIIPAPGDDEHKFAITDALEILTKTDAKNLEEKNSKATLDAETSEEAQTKAVLEIEKTEKATKKENDIAVLNIDSAIESNQKIAAQLNTKKSENNNNAVYKTAESVQKDNNLGSILSALRPTLTGNENRPLDPANREDIPARPMASAHQRLSNVDFNALFGETNKAKGLVAKLNISNLVQNATPPSLPTGGEVTLANGAETMAFQTSLSETLGFDINTGTPFNATMNAIHAATSTPQAGQTHPATQSVAAHMSKAAQKGEARAITLQLDPPELGRVEVRMEFGDDKSVKAHLVVEKPETLLMLQRDASALERALQNAGLETDSDSLDYQMAEDNYDFGSGKDGKGSNGQHANGGNGENAEDGDDVLIETTMTWDVDPETGHVHYSILA